MKRYFERSNASAIRSKKARQMQGALRARSLRLESLESREMLSVTTIDYAEITDAYRGADFTSYEDAKVTTIQTQAIPLDSLQNELDAAQTADAPVANALNVPENLTVTGTTSFTVALTWDAVEGAATYQIAYTNADDALWNIVSVDATQTTCVIENLVPETSYQIKIKAVAEENGTYVSSDYSDEINALTVAIQNLESVAITGDVAVGATLVATVTPENATVTWQWYRATALTDVPWIAIDNANDATYLVNTSDLGYYFKIVAIGYGDYDGIVEAIAQSATTQTLTAPENIAVTDVTATTVSVAWTDSDNAAGYKLAYRADDQADWIEIVGDANTTSFTLTDLTPGATYQIKLQALGDGDLYVESDYTDVITVSTTALTLLENVVLSGDYAVGEEIVATVSPQNAVVTYQWLRAESADAQEWIAIDGAQDAAYLLTANDLGLYVKVVATAVGEYAGQVEAVTDLVYTTLDVPTGLTATATSDTTIDVSWDDVENATAYQLKYKLATEEDQPTAWESVTILNGATSLTIEELDPQTAYDFKVMAFGDSNVYMNSDYSQIVTVTTEETPAPMLKQIVLTGTKAVGEYLFTNLEPTDATATYAWYRGDGENWTQIEDANATRYKLTEDDFGLYVRVVATGVGEYVGQVEAVTVKAIMKKIGDLTISGNTIEGETLTANLSTEGAAENATYSWFRGDGVNWIKIADANEQTYVLTAEDVGAYIMVRAAGVNGYTNFVETMTDTLVGDPNAVQAVTIKGTRAVGARLYAYVTPQDADVAYQWYRGQDEEWTAIDGATSYYYKQAPEDFGYYIKVVATGVGENSGQAEDVTTKATMILIGDAEIVGDLYLGNTLTVTLSADGAQENATYSWYRGDGENWTKIAGESAQTYVLTEDDLGYYIKARAVGFNGYTNSSEAVSADVVKYGTQIASVSIAGTRAVDAYLTATVAQKTLP